MLTIIAIICIIALIIGSITDIKTREVPDWLNYSLIAMGLGINTIYSITTANFSFITASVLGLAAFWCIAYILFKLGQWGGGDSKMLMGIGALVGLTLTINNFLMAFLFNVLIVGAIYSIVWGIFLSLKHRKKFQTHLKKIKTNKKLTIIKRLIHSISLLPLLLIILEPTPLIIIFSITLTLLINSSYYLYLFSSVIESAFMFKRIPPTQLTEGDWIAKNIKIKDKYICGPKDLGIGKKQIGQLIKLYKKNKIKNILIKQGLPFIPSFLLSFIITLKVGNLIFIFL